MHCVVVFLRRRNDSDHVIMQLMRGGIAMMFWCGLGSFGIVWKRGAFLLVGGANSPVLLADVQVHSLTTGGVMCMMLLMVMAGCCWWCRGGCDQI